MNCSLKLAALIVCIACLPKHASAQAVIAQPYNGQLRTDADVGNVQGIKNFGRTLRTDPDVGEGFSYHVHPVAEFPGMRQGGTLVQSGGAFDPNSRRLQNLHLGIEDAEQRLREAAEQGDSDDKDAALEDLRTAQLDYLWQAQQSGGFDAPAQFLPAPYITPDYASPFPPPFDSTQGLRNGPAAIIDVPGSPFRTGVQGPLQMMQQAMGVSRTGETLSAVTGGLYHQPLIQIRARVVEIVRGDSMSVSSVLDYISRNEGLPTLIEGNNVNEDSRNFSGGSRFDQPGLIDFPTTMAGQGLSSLTPSGALVNLTTFHINAIIRLLATELNADVVTAPEVVTLNGQNVEFIAGEKVPFELGQNVINGDNNNIQQFFYKHTGTYVSVTPRIVDWGFHGEGEGNAAISAMEITDWNALAEWMFVHELIDEEAPVLVKADKTEINLLPYRIHGGGSRLPVPITVKTELMEILNDYTRQQLFGMMKEGEESPFRELCPDGCDKCQWKAENCTIDLSVVIRLSDTGTVTLNTDTSGDNEEITINTAEKDIRAIANVVQVKSGHGVVMAGLIGESEVEEASKVPVLGDIPYVGFFFRSKATVRRKSEIVIFLEAEVLDPRPEVARAESARDFRLAAGYVEGDFLDNPLEVGMYRVGFGSYLPPTCCNEDIYWERVHRKVGKVCTHVDDAFE